MAGVQQAQLFTKDIVQSVRLPYLLYLPNDSVATSGSPQPLLLFLHGAGERGDDLERVKVYGPPKMVEQGKDLPFIVVSPQCPTDGWWSVEALGALLDEVEQAHRVDLDRVYCTGLSMGGFGTWALALRFPNRFAAIAPICGGGQVHAVCNIKHVPVWAFHGAKDAVVPLKRSEEMVEALQQCGGNVRLTVYPEAGHDSWTETYAIPELFSWLLSHRRSA